MQKAIKHSHYRNVVIGGGIVGCSIAKHLAEKTGSSLLLEASTLTSGTTWHAAGMLAQLKGSPIMTELVKRSIDKFQEWTDIGWYNTGSLAVARTQDRWNQLRMLANQVEYLGIPCKFYCGSDLSDLTDLHPLLRTDHLVGAIYLPTDGIVNPADVTMRIAQEAKEHGAEIVQFCTVDTFDTSVGRNGVRGVHALRTSKGDVTCDNVVIACGQWTRDLLKKIPGIMRMPVAPVSHQYVVFDKMEGVTNNIPVIRDYDSRIYIKPEVGGLAVGAFEENPPIQPLCRDLYEEDLEKSEAGLIGAIETIPGLEEIGIKAYVHGADCHSVDHLPLLGRVPHTENLFVACGFNSQGIQTGYAVGDMMSEIVLEGEAMSFKFDSTCVDVARFDPKLTESDEWCQGRAIECYGDMYAVAYPGLDWQTLRDARCSALHDVLKKEGAVFGSVPSQGWERPLWFGDGSYSREPRDLLSFNARSTAWYEATRSEHLMCRHDVVLFDMSSFGKFEVSGPGSYQALEFLTSASIGCSNSRVIYTQLLNDKGGIESDLTVVPLNSTGNSFYCVTGAGIVHRDMSYITKQARALGVDLEVKDTTDEVAVLALMGPKSKIILGHITKDLVSLDDADFPFGTWKEIGFGKALRMSFVGELGWELHVPRESAPAVLHSLQVAHMELFGEPLPLGGYNAILRSLRVEKRFVHYGHDVTTFDTPLEAGMLFVNSKLKAGTEFIAREALLKQKEEGVKKRLVSFKVNDPSVSLWGHENIFRNGEMVGYLTTGGVGYTVNNGNAIGLGYVKSASETVNKKYIEAGNYELEVMGKRVQATVSFSPLYDPSNTRMKSSSASCPVELETEEASQSPSSFIVGNAPPHSGVQVRQI